MNDLKVYRNKNLGQFTSIPQKMTDDSSQLDPLYLATHFHKLRTQTVAHIRKSKHYATTLAAWQKKLKGVDVSDLAAVAKTLGLNLEVFNPLAPSSEPQTLFSGGGRSKRKAQLLKVKKGVFKPMRAGAIIDELPPDMLRDVVGRLDPQDQSALLDVSRGVREDTMAVLPAQEKLWAAAKILSVEDAKTALEEGARVNKIEPSVGMNVLKMMEGKNGSEALDDYLKRQGGKPLNLEQINKHLARCVKAMVNIYDSEPDSDEYYPYTEDYYVDDILNTEFEQVREALLDGADANTRTKYNSYNYIDKEPIEGSLLHALTVRAIEFDNDYAELIVDTIKLLSSFDIDMNQVDMNPKAPDSMSEMTALHYACWVAGDDRNEPPNAGIRPSIVKALLESGIDVNKQDSRGETVLHKLAQYPTDEPSLQQEDISLARLLLSHGADVSIINGKGRRVIDYTEEYPDYVTYDPVMLDVLLRATETREDFIQAVKDGNVNSVKQFVQQGVPVNTIINKYGDTPLHKSAKNGHLEVVRALIEKGADVNAKDDKYGETPLHTSAQNYRRTNENRHLEVARALIEAGADVHARDREYRRPLDYDPRLAEFQQNGVRPRQGDDDDQGQGRNVRQRVGGGGNTGVDVDFNADSRGAGYGEDDAALAKAIEVLFAKMKNLKMKHEVLAHLKA